MPAIVTVTTVVTVVITNHLASNAVHVLEANIILIMFTSCSRDGDRMWSSEGFRVLSLPPK